MLHLQTDVIEWRFCACDKLRIEFLIDNFIINEWEHCIRHIDRLNVQSAAVSTSSSCWSTCWLKERFSENPMYIHLTISCRL